MKIPIKAISINDCFQGRRFRTKDFIRWQELVLYLLKSYKGEKFGKDIVGLNLKFYCKHPLASDYDNKIKPFQDCLVKAGIIADDRYIFEAHQNKIKSEEDYIEFEIYKLNGRKK